MGKIMLDTSFPNNPAWIREGGAYAQALHLGALAYSDAQGLDGVIPAELVPRLAFACPPERAETSAKMLVEFGFWSEGHVPGHYVINDYERTNFTKAQADAFRDREAAKKRRQRLHNAGDHSLCTNPKWCPNVPEASPKVSRGDKKGDKRGTGPRDTRGSIPVNSIRYDPKGVRIDVDDTEGPSGPASGSAGAPPMASPPVLKKTRPHTITAADLPIYDEAKVAGMTPANRAYSWDLLHAETEEEIDRLYELAGDHEAIEAAYADTLDGLMAADG